MADSKGARSSPNPVASALPQRSLDSAAETQKAFSKEQRDPLASSKPTESKPGVTFAAQDSLPKLPIPDLDSTCKKYLDALSPLQSAREHDDSVSAVDEFLRSDGPELQEKLKRWATGQSSYIEQFWYDSYLNYDNPVVLNLNPFFLLEDDPTPARNNQVTRAASLVISALAFVRAVRKEELPPDMIRGQPLCMYQYSRLFGTSRIPTHNGCQIVQDENAKHVVVLCRGQFYWFDVLDDNSDVIMTETDVAQNLQTCINDAEMLPIQDAAKASVGVLSTENRKIWSGLRDVLSRDDGSNNSECLSIVDSALFILCLDGTEPATQSDLCMNMLCGTSEVVRGVQIGTCTNRYYDKLQIICCKNGSAGINFEHTGVDGHTVLRFASDLYTDTILRYAKSINGQAPSLWASTSPDPAKRDPQSFGDVSTVPHKLEWDMIPELNIAIRFAETRLADLIQQNEFYTLEFMHYGKNFMTSMGFSPDAFVQMAFQAAYYGLYGRVECGYEPAMTKQFFHGRTEAIRSVTHESTEFVRTFWGDNPASQKVDALRKACQKHTAVTKECSKAEGQDRHLYALYCVWQRLVDDDDGGLDRLSNGSYSPRSESSPGLNSPAKSSEDGSPHSQKGHTNGNNPQLPVIFTDPGWDKLNNTVLSTSNCGNPSLRHFGFGPTSAEGFGIGYIIKETSVSVCASSKHRQTKRFIESMESYFLEIRKLLRQTQAKSGTQIHDKTHSRAREIESSSASAAGGRRKSQGRALVGDGRTPPATMALAVEDDAGDDEEESDDDGLGGYGFFDAGMLLKAQKANSDKHGEKPSEQAMRRVVGKKLRLMEY